MASIMSDGHSTALNLSRRLCLKLWMTQFSGTYWCSHLFNSPLAALALQPVASQYLRKAKTLSSLASRRRLEVHRAAPTSGIHSDCLWSLDTSTNEVWGLCEASSSLKISLFRHSIRLSLPIKAQSLSTTLSKGRTQFRASSAGGTGAVSQSDLDVC